MKLTAPAAAFHDAAPTSADTSGTFDPCNCSPGETCVECRGEVIPNIWRVSVSLRTKEVP